MLFLPSKDKLFLIIFVDKNFKEKTDRPIATYHVPGVILVCFNIDATYRSGCAIVITI